MCRSFLCKVRRGVGARGDCGTGGGAVDAAPAFETTVWDIDTWAYQQWRDSRELPGVDFAAQSAGELSLQNDLNGRFSREHIFLAQMKGWLRDQPEVAAALMSGSGSTMFAVLRDFQFADAIAARAREELDPTLWACAAQS